MVIDAIVMSCDGLSFTARLDDRTARSTRSGGMMRRRDVVIAMVDQSKFGNVRCSASRVREIDVLVTTREPTRSSSSTWRATACRSTVPDREGLPAPAERRTHPRTTRELPPPWVRQPGKAQPGRQEVLATTS